MTTDFKNAMSQRTDEELIKIVTILRNDYQPSAIEVAEDEIKKRGLDSTQTNNMQADLEEKIEKEKEFNSKKVSSWIRLANYIIDFIAWIILFMILVLIVGLFYNLDIILINHSVTYALLIILYLGYYIFMEHKYQKTIGKFITKTKVLTKDGKKAKLSDIMARTFCRLIPFDWLSYFFTSNGFHDRLSNTTVIKTRLKSKNTAHNKV